MRRPNVDLFPRSLLIEIPYYYRVLVFICATLIMYFCSKKIERVIIEELAIYSRTCLSV